MVHGARTSTAAGAASGASAGPGGDGDDLATRAQAEQGGNRLAGGSGLVVAGWYFGFRSRGESALE